ncbi:MAG: GlsB/YeaQ/YmgE family stress response membrane protein [Pseudobdellovibrionaceae bacterium]
MLWAVFIGLLVGVIAKFFMPGKDPGGFIVTILLGIAGAFVANWLGSKTGYYQFGEQAGIFASILGAMLILLAYRIFFARRV